MQRLRDAWKWMQDLLLSVLKRRHIPPMTIVITLACIIGVLSGYGAALFTLLIHTVSHWSVEQALQWAADNPIWTILVVASPALGLVAVALRSRVIGRKKFPDPFRPLRQLNSSRQSP